MSLNAGHKATLQNRIISAKCEACATLRDCARKSLFTFGHLLSDAKFRKHLADHLLVHRLTRNLAQRVQCG